MRAIQAEAIVILSLNFTLNLNISEGFGNTCLEIKSRPYVGLHKFPMPQHVADVPQFWHDRLTKSCMFPSKLSELKN